jgi:hypothetical protein
MLPQFFFVLATFVLILVKKTIYVMSVCRGVDLCEQLDQVTILIKLVQLIAFEKISWAKSRPLLLKN